MANVIGTLNSLTRVYVDEHDPTDLHDRHHRDDVTGWHQSSIRKGVVDALGRESQEFAEWKERCLGRVVVQPEMVDRTGNYVKIPKWYAYFETQEDLVSYLLTFDEREAQIPVADSAAYYCPYVPLTSSGVIINSDTLEPVVRFMTRYGNVSTGGSELD